VHEQDFKQALRDGMANLTTPTMNENVVLDAAKRAVRRRRAMWASGASALAVVALATGVALAAPGADRSGPQVGVEITSTNPSSDTEPNWPDGQTDATASSGPHYEQGLDVLNKLLEVVPPGYDSPADLTTNGQAGGFPLRYQQAVWSDDDSWDYDATIPVVKADKFGSLSVSVAVPANFTGTDEALCANLGESCTEMTVAGEQVGVATRSGRMVALYRHSDGTEVVLSQGALPVDYGYPGLTELPFTAEQLAELATDPRFHLD
jgi:hypothetical protein